MSLSYSSTLALVNDARKVGLRSLMAPDLVAARVQPAWSVELGRRSPLLVDVGRGVVELTQHEFEVLCVAAGVPVPAAPAPKRIGRPPRTLGGAP